MIALSVYVVAGQVSDGVRGRVEERGGYGGGVVSRNIDRIQSAIIKKMAACRSEEHFSRI